MGKTTVRKSRQLFEKVDSLKPFFEEPEREFHLREISRLIGLAPSTASKHLSELVEYGIITTRSSKGFKLFKSDTESTLYKDSKLFYNLYKIRCSGLIEFLADELNHPKSIILFGSFRKSENIPESDIDIFIETAGKKEINLTKFEKKIGLPVQLFQFSSNEIEQMKSKNKELVNNIINGIKLSGYIKLRWKKS